MNRDDAAPPGAAPRSANVLSLKLKGVSPGIARAIRAVLGGLTGFDAFNRLYASLPPSAPLDLPQRFLEAMAVPVRSEGTYPASIPAAGPVVIVANHPFGLIEGMAIHQLLLAARRDSTMVMVHWLAQIPEFASDAIFVGPRHVQRRRGRSVTGLRESLGWLKQGHCLAVFPASHVERFIWRKGRVADLDWSAHVAMLIRRTGATTIPVFVRGHNSLTFRLLTALCPPLITMLMIREFLNKRGRPIVSVWGDAIPASRWAEGISDEEVIRQLQDEVAALGRT